MTETVRKVLIALTVVFAALGIASDQIVTRGYIASNIGSGFTWLGSAQSWSGSTVTLSCGDWNSFIKNDGTACPASKTVLYSFASAHALNQTTHSPILANNTFVGGGFASWSSANGGACAGYPFAGQNASDQDGDVGYASASSGGCTSGNSMTLTQTFSIVGAPTSQTYSFWYNGPATSAGDATNCTAGSGSATLTVTVNGTTVASPTLILDGTWRQVTGTMSALANGSNTIIFTAALVAAAGNNSHYNPKTQQIVCNSYTTKVTQPFSLDDIVLSAVY